MILGAYQFQSAYLSVKLRSDQVGTQGVLAFSRELKALLEARVEVVKALAASATSLMRQLQPLDQEFWTANEHSMLMDLQLLTDEMRSRSNYFDFMYIARMRGEALAISPRFASDGTSYVGSNYRSRDYFQSLIRTERVAISQVQLGKRSKKPNIQIVAPIKSRSGELIGLSEGSVNLDVVTEASKLLRMGGLPLTHGNGRLLVLDHLNKILVDTSEDQELLSTFNPIRLVQLTRNRINTSSGNEIDVDGEMWRTNLSIIDVEGDLEWKVVYLRNSQQLKSEALKDALTALIPSFLLILLILFAGNRFSRRLSQDVYTLSSALDEIERGEDPLSLMDDIPNVQISEWISLFQHAHQFSITLKEKQAELTSSLDTQRKINESQRSLLAALEHIREGIVITDHTGLILYANSQAQALEKYVLNEQRLPDQDDLKADNSVFLTPERTAQLSRGEMCSGDHIVRIHGEDRHLQLTLSPQLNHQNLNRVIIILRDVTEELKQREALKTSERLVSVGSLAAGIAHEVNNPLMYILASLDFAIEEISEEEISEIDFNEVTQLLEQAKSGAKQVHDISKSLLNIAHKEREAQWTSLAESVQLCIRLIKTEVKHQSQLDVHVDSRGYFYGNSSELSQVLMNLIHNALYAMQETKELRAPKVLIKVHEINDRSQEDKRWGVIEVTDNGPGISDHVVHRLFDPFFTTKSRGVGTGLGLSICQRLIHDMGGTLTLQTELGVGTTFRVTLPITSTIHIDERKTSETVEPKRRDSKLTARVLVVDDIVEITDLIYRQLKRNYDIQGVNSGQEALEMLGKQQFDLILSDVMMPEMSGTQLYLKAIAQWPELFGRFIFMTGGILEEADIDFFDRHEISCLHKPVSRKELLQEFEAKLNQVTEQKLIE